MGVGAAFQPRFSRFMVRQAVRAGLSDVDFPQFVIYMNCWKPPRETIVRMQRTWTVPNVETVIAWSIWNWKNFALKNPPRGRNAGNGSVSRGGS